MLFFKKFNERKEENVDATAIAFVDYISSERRVIKQACDLLAEGEAERAMLLLEGLAGCNDSLISDLRKVIYEM